MLTAEQRERHNRLMEKLPKVKGYLQKCLNDLRAGKDIIDPLPRAKIPTTTQGDIC